MAVTRWCSPGSRRSSDASANNERPEQGQWWEETEKCFEGEVRFTDSDEVDSFLAGGSNDAGFVQVMKGREMDRDRVHALDEQFEAHAASFRPDLLGRVPDVDRTGHATSRSPTSRARRTPAEGESKEPPAELAAQMGEFEAMMANVEFVDLRDPWLF